MGRRGGDHPVDDVPHLWRRTVCSRRSTRACAQYVEYQRQDGGRPAALEQRLALRRLARLRHDPLRLSGRDDGQGPHRDGVLRPLHRSARADGAACSARPRTRAPIARCSSRSGGVGQGVRHGHGPARARTRRPRMRSRWSSGCFPRPAAPTRPTAARRQRAAVRPSHDGFLGTPYLTDALTETGHLAEAYRLLLNKRYPSWLYPITQGATTIWERWDGQKPDRASRTSA